MVGKIEGGVELGCMVMWLIVRRVGKWMVGEWVDVVKDVGVSFDLD